MLLIETLEVDVFFSVLTFASLPLSEIRFLFAMFTFAVQPESKH